MAVSANFADVYEGGILVLGGIQRRLTYANVMGTLAVFLVLGGGAYAASQLEKNTVKSKHIVNGEVKRQDLAQGAVSADKLAPSEFQTAGLPFDANHDCSGVQADSWASYDDSGEVGYYRDPAGRVYLQGYITRCGNAPTTMLTLPPGYRPAQSVEIFSIPNLKPDTQLTLRIQSDGTVRDDANPTVVQNLDVMSFSGINFRCGPSGADGCP